MSEDTAATQFAMKRSELIATLSFDERMQAMRARASSRAPNYKAERNIDIFRRREMGEALTSIACLYGIGVERVRQIHASGRRSCYLFAMLKNSK